MKEVKHTYGITSESNGVNKCASLFLVIFLREDTNF